MYIQEIIALIDKLSINLAILLCHNNADPDALGASFALSELLKQLRPNLETEIAIASGPSKLSKQIMTIIPIEFTVQPCIEEAGMLILVDTNNVQQLDEWGKRIKSDQILVLVDHHARHLETENLATISVVDEETSSACELVYNLFKEAEVKPSSEAAKAIFLGIAFDTRHFVIAKSSTFKVISELIDIGVNVQEILPILSMPMDYSERVARLTASSRVKLLKRNDWLIAFSNVSSYQASAARALISLGAHMAVVAGKKNGKIQVSFRSTNEFYVKTGIHLGVELAKPVGDFLGGMGGGHAISAGANGVG
ncbi:MAG: DHH family phosphoesterase, partial [Candidatus Bathyarchaeota archaeon]